MMTYDEKNATFLQKFDFDKLTLAFSTSHKATYLQYQRQLTNSIKK